MAEIVRKIEDLTHLDDAIHWFCPRAADTDEGGLYYDEDCTDSIPTEPASEKKARLAKVQEAEGRKQEALEACKILAFEGPDAEPYQERLKAALKTQLTRCDICIREFHRSRAPLKLDLEAEHEPEEVQAFFRKFDAMNIARISSGLNVATENLVDMPPEKRSITTAGSEGMYALFEALNCVQFLRDEEALQQFFDKPFRLAQTKKKLKLPTYAPGMVAFLFQPNVELRYSWAQRNFIGNKRLLNAAEFENNVKPFLEAAANRVNILSLDPTFLAPFWKATRLIISKLTKELISNHLRPMDLNLYTLAMEHWQLDAGHFTDMVACYQRLLELSPTDFWEAVSGINGHTIVENILQSPEFQRMLKQSDEKEHLRLEEKLAWVIPFVRSIKPANLVSPAGALLNQLLHQFQDKSKYSKYAISVTWHTGLRALRETISLVKSLKGGPVVVHLLEVIGRDHIQFVLQEMEGIEKKQEQQLDETEQLALEIVEASLALDVHNLAHSRNVILKTKALDHEIGVSSLNIWKIAMRKVVAGHPALPTAIITGITDLLPLEPFAKRQKDAAPKQTEAWNHALSRLQRHVKEDLLERLESFTPEQLFELYAEQQAAKGLMTLLFSGSDPIHQSTLNIFKALSGEDNRRDTIMHLIKVFFGTTLGASANAQNTIAGAGNFGPCLTFLKVSRDVLDCLCCTEDGTLRTMTLSKGDAEALESLWQTTWATIEMIFRETEAWSNLGHDKSDMQEFCRSTMDFADFAFDQFSVIANSLTHARESSSTLAEVRKALLKYPTKAFDKLTKWLRLRDDYLITKAVSLTSKILNALEVVGIKVDEKASQYVEDVVMSTEKNAKVKTKLSRNQKAELRQALEKHIGEELEGTTDVQPKKQGTLAGWATPGSDSSRGSTPAPGVKTKTGSIDVDAWAARSEADKLRRQQMSDHDKAYSDLIAGVSKGSDAYKQMQAKKSATGLQKAAQQQQKAKQDQNAFLLKRKQEKAAAEKAKADAIAKQKLGAGSGVAGLGDLGKDHSRKGQNVYISSDESEEDDDEPSTLDDDLFGLGSRGRIQRPNVDPNGAVGLRPEVRKGPTRIQRTARSVKDMRARLAPDLQPLHKVILKWDFFYEGDYPPGSNPNIFQPVQNSYRDPSSYQETFEPLLTLEAWQGMIKSREENTAKPYQVKVQNRSNVDNFVEISSIVSHVENRDLALQEGDVVLLSKAARPCDDGSAPHCLARINKLKRQKGHVEVVYHLMPGTSLAPSLTPQASVFGMKIQSLVPLEREYGALKGLQYYDLCNQITRAAPSKRINFSEKQVQQAQDVYNVNRAQSEAINAALENDGFSLIQGPPGSGKTKTIVAIVGGLLTQTLGSSTAGTTKISMPSGYGNQSSDTLSRKLLVCAPSNAAVDELVMRLKDGVKTRHGKHHQLNIVRIGRSDAINTQVRDVTMDELVAKRLGGSNSNNDQQRAQNLEVFKEHEKVSGMLRELYEKRDTGTVKGKELTNLEHEIVSVRKRKNELGVRIDKVRDDERNNGREQELNRKRAQQAVLDGAHVICATLSGSGHDMFQSLNIEFETVIIDEAAQCVEMSSLIPLKYGCVKCVLVGDPKQLPPTVFSKEAAKFQYEQSLFVRMQNNFADEVHLLDTQYRMHPDISVFPSRTFYDGLLKDGDGMAGLRKRPWHASALLAPYRFFDVHGQHQSAPKGHSLINLAEIEVAMALYDRLTSDFTGYEYAGRIGIITPYKSQLRQLKERFSQRYGNGIIDVIEFNTTDAFQGRESEIIIFSCVRASPSGGIGFLQDIRRMNVGLTRAKSSLWVLGNSESLSRGQFWRKLVDDAQARDAYTTGNVIAMLKQPSSAFPASSTKTHSMYDVASHVAQMEGGQKGKTPSTGDSRRLSTEVARSTADPRKSATPAAPSGEPQDKMEGIRYRYEDRAAKKRPASSEPGTNKKAFHRPDESGDNDVEMADVDAESAVSGTATPHNGGVSSLDGARSRAETPLSAASGSEGKVGDQADGNAKSRPPSVAPAVAPAVLQGLKKRPTASPFMPKKPKR